MDVLTTGIGAQKRSMRVRKRVTQQLHKVTKRLHKVTKYLFKVTQIKIKNKTQINIQTKNESESQR